MHMHFLILSDGTIGSVGSKPTADIEDAGNGWYRCTIKRSKLNYCVFLLLSDLAKTWNDSDSTSVGDAYLYGAQLTRREAIQHPTYLPMVLRV